MVSKIYKTSNYKRSFFDMNILGTFLHIYFQLISLNIFISILPLKFFTIASKLSMQKTIYCKFSHHICKRSLGLFYYFDVFITRSLLKGLVKLDSYAK